jgi:pimeloyl-ACP methyl ester carboxylesterase
MRQSGPRVFQKETITAGAFEIPVAASGTGPRTLICVNGMQQTMAVWRSLVKRMALTDYRTVLFDFPNQGRAAASVSRGSLTLHEQVGVLHAVVRHVSPAEPVSLIGGSWGSLVAAAFAATHPRRVSRMVLGGFQTRPNAKLRDVAQRGRALLEAGRGPELSALFAEEFGHGIDASRRAAIDAQFRALRPEQFRQMYDSARLLVEQVDFETMFDLSVIEADTLLINGDQDPLVDWSLTPSIAARFPTASWRVEPGVGHFLHFERPSLVNLYARFLTADADATEGAASGDVGREVTTALEA